MPRADALPLLVARASVLPLKPGPLLLHRSGASTRRHRAGVRVVPFLFLSKTVPLNHQPVRPRLLAHLPCSSALAAAARHETAQLPCSRARALRAAFARSTLTRTPLVSVCAVTPIHQRLAPRGCGPSTASPTSSPTTSSSRLCERAHGHGWPDADRAGSMRCVLVPAREQVCESRAAHATAIAAASAAHARTRQGAAAWASSTARSRPIGLHARAELVRYARASCDAHGCMLLVSRLVCFVMCVRLAVSYPNCALCSTRRAKISQNLAPVL